jgi:HAE1 family hydrophobic/amphiphilic exporter-1
MKTYRLWAAARNFASLSLILFCVLLVAAPVAAQDTPAQENSQATSAQQNSQSQDAQPVARPIPQRTVGLEPGKVVKWTLREAVLAVLENNPDIELERSNVRLAQYELFAAQGVYDRTSTAGISYNSFTQGNTRLFSGTTSTTTSQQQFTYNTGLQQLIERTGGNYSVNFNNQRNTNNFGTLSPQYNPQLSFNLTQPLFRNFKTDINRRQISIAKKSLDLSDAQFRQRAIEIISSVQQAYWDLALAIRNEEIARDSVKLAETQLNNNKRQVEVGTLAPIDVISAATSLETRRQKVFQAMDAVAQAENQLKALTVKGQNDDIWNAQIVPVESFEIQQVTLPLNDATKLALDNRPELKRFSLQKEISQINVDYFKNQTKPQIDFVGSYAMIGTAGTRNANNPLAVAVPACVPGQAPPPSGCLPANLLGGYGSALGNLFKNDFRTWSIGVNISLPWRNRVAKANLAREVESGKQLDLQTRKMLQTIEAEVRNAVQSVETAKLRIDAAKLAREYAEKQLEGEEKKFAAGLTATFFVLQRQNELSQARFDELRALADYNKAVVQLQRVISTTLSSNSIEIKAEAPVTIK